jgi:hypothetical protein
MGERHGAVDGGPMAARPRLLEPSFRFGDTIEEETGKEFTAVQLERLIPPTGRSGRIECGGVAEQNVVANADLAVTASDQSVLAQAFPQIVQRLAQRVPRALAVLLGPEQAEQRLTAVESGLAGEVRQERQPFRLREHGTHLEAIAAEIDHAERQ